MSEKVIFSVAILSYNGKKDLKKVLTELETIEYTKDKLEIIVVDNNSKDGTAKMARDLFPNVQLISLPKNLGMSGLNSAFKIIRGKYCLVLDHDSFIESKGLLKALREFQIDKKLGVLACNIINPFTKQSELNFLPQNLDYSMYWSDFIGGGVIIRKSIFEKVGFFSPDVFMYGHETEFSLRVLNSGYDIKYAPFIRVYRTNNPNTLTDQRVKLAAQNLLSVYWQHLSIRGAILMSASILTIFFILSLQSKTTKAFAEGILSFLESLPKIIGKRQQISKVAEHRWAIHYPFTMRNCLRRALGIYEL